ncbi:glycosyltransferase [Bradyrhizobium liaoningense]
MTYAAPAKPAEASKATARVVYLCRPLGVPDHDRCTALGQRFGDVLALEWLQNTAGYIWSLDQNRIYRMLSFQGTGHRLNRCLQAMKFIAAVCRSRADIALVYDYHVPLFFSSAILFRLMGAHVISMNDSKFDDYDRFILTDLAKYLLLLPYHSILAGSSRAAAYLRYLGKRHIAIYHCAINVLRVSQGSDEARTTTPFADRSFIAIGRFVPKKNYSRLLEAFESYASNSQDPRRLTICGYGPLNDAIIAQIAQSETLSRLVDVKGYVTSDEIPSHLGRSLALLLPSTEEQFGIVVTEALAAEIPVMLSQECGATDLVVEGENGFIVRSSDINQMARVMRHVASDEQSWRKMSARCREHAFRAHVDIFVDGIERLSGRLRSAPAVHR